ncbi:MAG: hypothetical protein HQL99_13470 [Magnetococcales bacterium]|nr:hypothetical protein [Magnetococcales bacterium]
MRRFEKGLPFHVSLLTIFVTVLSTFSGLVTWYNYSENAATATTAARELLHEMNQKIVERFQGTYDPVIALTEILAAVPTLSVPPTFEQPHPALDLMFKILRQHPQIHSLHMVHDNGDFLELANLKEYPDFLRSLQAPEATAFGMLILQGANGENSARQQWRFLNADHLEIGAGPVENSRFDPRTRPGFIPAQDPTPLKISRLYVHHAINKPGITVSRRFQGGEGHGVIGVNLTMSRISLFLREQNFRPSSQLILFDNDGDLIAHPDETRSVRVERDPVSGVPMPVIASVADLGDPVLDALMYNRQQDGQWQNSIIFEVQGQTYIGQITPVAARYAKGTWIAITVPLDEFLGPIAQTGMRSLLFGLFALLITIPIVVFIAVGITRALRQLAAETVLIRKFQLSGPVQIRSSVQEIRQLTASIGAMKVALNTFGQYVPKALVRQLIETGEAMGLEGERRALTLMFTDVADFTTMAETMPPEQLTRTVSEYFGHLGEAIHAYGGTIDKYIGDSIMAFWNAPVRLEEHARMACLGALYALVANERLNRVWSGQGKPILLTRFGLHTGDAIIGNIGSEDRMDYTAMGGTVNLSSRIEGMNKFYGTRILVSDAVVEQAGSGFVFRPVDTVIPKGATLPLTLFELMGLEEGPDEVRVGPEQRQELHRWLSIHDHYRHRRWQEALEGCESLLALLPGHRLATLYRQRCQEFLRVPPPDAWNGAQAFAIK